MGIRIREAVPRELFDWITSLTEAVPSRSVVTFIELLIGGMLSSSGFVGDAFQMLTMRRKWTGYQKWLETGKWSWLSIGRQFTRLALSVIQPEIVHLVIDDTVTLRASKKAPGVKRLHQHGNKPNLASYVNGQSWVSLAMIAHRPTGEAIALPLLSRLMSGVGNSTKLSAARTLIRAVSSLFGKRKVRVLVDSWYMRGVFIKSMIARNFPVIGQVRIDTRLYEHPPERKPKQRGRPRQYGDKITRDTVKAWESTTATVQLYGKQQRVRYRSKLLKARFLGGLLVRAVWCELERKPGVWTPIRLFISTDTSLSAEQVLEIYGYRWPIEPLFYALKHACGLKNAWQQTRQVLSRWVHIKTVGYGLTQLLSCLNDPLVTALCGHSPWWKNTPQTAGQVRKGLVLAFRHVAVFHWWNVKCKKFLPPSGLKIPQLE